MITFLYHDGIQKEIVRMGRRFRTLKEGFTMFERLCQVQFHPTNPQQAIAPAKLHRIHQNELWTLWKAEVVIPGSGLRPNQWPRVWFAVKGDILVFLCLSSHIDNYNNAEMEKVAFSRVSEFF